MSTKLDATKLETATKQAVALLEPSDTRPFKDWGVTYGKLFYALDKGKTLATPDKELWAEECLKLDAFVNDQHHASGRWDHDYTKVVYQLVIWIFHFLKRYPDATNLTEKHLLAFIEGRPVHPHYVVKANYTELGVMKKDGVNKWHPL